MSRLAVVPRRLRGCRVNVVLALWPFTVQAKRIDNIPAEWLSGTGGYENITEQTKMTK